MREGRRENKLMLKSSNLSVYTLFFRRENEKEIGGKKDYSKENIEEGVFFESEDGISICD